MEVQMDPVTVTALYNCSPSSHYRGTAIKRQKIYQPSLTVPAGAL
jgi:hypothetical protein